MIISKILSKIDISNLRFRRSPEKEKEKPSLIKEVIDEPEKSRNERLSPEQGLFLFFCAFLAGSFMETYIFSKEKRLCVKE